MIGTLIVSQEEMRAAASELSGYISYMDGCFQRMKRTMDLTNGYWTGDAGDAHRQLYQEQVENIAQIIARYQEHVRDLNEMAGLYSDALSRIATMIDGLAPSEL